MRRRHLDIEDRTQDLADQLRDEPEAAQEFLRMYELSWIHHENALEGVMFTGQEIETALENLPVADASSLNAFRDVRNFKAATGVIREEALVKPRITLELVRKLYQTLHAGNESRLAADFRKEIPLHRAYFHDIAQPVRIQELLAKLLAWTESPDFEDMHPVQRASKLQHSFMQVYPYTEGSGKIARLLANLLLIHDGYQPCIIHTIDRQRYYESLKQAEPVLRDLMMESMENGLANAEKYLRHAVRLRRAAAHGAG
jgi:Fic family protein